MKLARRPETLSLINRLLDEDFIPFGINPWANFDRSMMEPPIDVIENDSEFLIRAETPGMTRDDINVFIEDDSVIIEGNMQEIKEDENFLVKETRRTSFRRSIRLPAKFDEDSIEATFDNGMLVIKASKSNPQKHKIEIK